MQDNYTRPELLEIATRKEQACARQLVRQGELLLEQALREVLLASSKQAGLNDIAELAAQRQAAQQQLAENKRRQRAAKLAAKRGHYGGKQGNAELEELASTLWSGWFDGSALPNPGKCRFACVLKAPDGQIFEYASSLEFGDSCDAEYSGLILALEKALQHQPRELLLYGDSQVVVDDFNLRKASKLERMADYRLQAHTLAKRFASMQLRWIPRQKNQLADALTQVRK